MLAAMAELVIVAGQDSDGRPRELRTDADGRVELAAGTADVATQTTLGLVGGGGGVAKTTGFATFS